MAAFKIRHSLTASNRRYQFSSQVTVHDLGLRLADVEAMGLQSENQHFKKRPKADTLRRWGATEEEIEFLLSGRRVELNAMTSPQMVEWIERKLAEAGVTKVVPDIETLQAGYRHLVAIRQMQRVIDQAREQIESEADAAIIPDDLRELVQQALVKRPHLSWDEALAEIAKGLAESFGGAT